MESITFALAGAEHPVPGIDCALAAGLFVMHAQPVRDWIAGQQAAAGNHSLVVIADDEWINPGGSYRSLTVPADERDIEALGSIREKVARDAPGFKVIETGTMTGWKQYLNNMNTDPWPGTFTREQALADVEWRTKTGTGRYAYDIVPVQPYMTGNDEARNRHGSSHGSHRMEDCADVDCREAAIRLHDEELDRRLAALNTGIPVRDREEGRADG